MVRCLTPKLRTGRRRRRTGSRALQQQAGRCGSTTSVSIGGDDPQRIDQTQAESRCRQIRGSDPTSPSEANRSSMPVSRQLDV